MVKSAFAAHCAGSWLDDVGQMIQRHLMRTKLPAPIDVRPLAKAVGALMKSEASVSGERLLQVQVFPGALWNTRVDRLRVEAEKRLIFVEEQQARLREWQDNGWGKKKVLAAALRSANTAEVNTRELLSELAKLPEAKRSLFQIRFDGSFAHVRLLLLEAEVEEQREFDENYRQILDDCLEDGIPVRASEIDLMEAFYKARRQAIGEYRACLRCEKKGGDGAAWRFKGIKAKIDRLYQDILGIERRLRRARYVDERR